jgi:CheY-like chemotaxis protein
LSTDPELFDSPPKILCVDDEPQVLEGLKRNLLEDFEVYTATSGADALQLLQNEGPFEVLVSDMRMPKMNGAELLGRARRLNIDTTRLLLTGHSDLESAIAAVNEGAIFRFLAKPCAPEVLRAALADAARQYRLVRVEKQLLEQTLVGTVRLMTEVLELAAPSAFRRSSHVRAIAAHMVRGLGLEHGWMYETAAVLSQIGCIALPSELVERALASQSLTAQEKQTFAEHPAVAHRLLRQISRLEPVAEMVRLQRPDMLAAAPRDAPHRLGAELLCAALEFDNLLARGFGNRQSLEELRRQRLPVRAEVLDTLRNFAGLSERQLTRVVYARELTPAMTLDEDVRTLAGALVVGKGKSVDRVTIERLHRFATGVGLNEPFRVVIDVAE